MRLALFDLDNTLLGGDSDHAWGEFLIDQGIVEAKAHAKANNRFYEQYQKGVLDISEYVHFTLKPVLSLSAAELKSMHDQFMAKYIEPIILNKALQLVQSHKDQGDYCIIITATNTFITKPIADRFAVDLLIGTELVSEQGHFTGAIKGIPCIQEGKVQKLTAWLESIKKESPLTNLRLEDAIFYSDSINDLPLLEKVASAIVVDGDAPLTEEAKNRGWPTISLREA